MAKQRRRVGVNQQMPGKRSNASKRKRAAKPQRKARSSIHSVIAVYIHGIGPHPPADEWKVKWDLALFGNDMGSRTRGAYWADILHAHGDVASLGRTAKASTAMDARSILSGTSLADHNDAVEFADGLLESLSGLSTSATRRGARKKITFLPGIWRRPVTQAFLRWFVRDTASYFFDPAVRDAIRGRFMEHIPAKGSEPFVVVAHSQGSIIAYDVLHQMPLTDRPEVELFATAGSPLGIQEIQDHLVTSPRLRVPDGLNVWHNFADRLDPVALDAVLADDAQDFDRVRDHQIVNQRVRELRGWNPHDSVGYLSHPEVRRIVHRAMQFDSGGRFVVARDVASHFDEPGTRQSVLIEVLEPNYPAVGESDDMMQNRESADDDQNTDTLAGRITTLQNQLKTIVRRSRPESQAKRAVLDARILPLRKYVAARLTTTEIAELARWPGKYHVYAVWRCAQKRKLLHRSHSVIGADAARASYGADGRGITWAVLDTGCFSKHPHFLNEDLGPTVIDVLDCTTDSARPTRITSASPKELDPDGHGTHVCGIIAGMGKERQQRYRGVAALARLLVYKVLDRNGEGDDAWIIKAIDDIFRRNERGVGIKIHGVNLSLGGPFDASVYGCGYSPLCKDLRDLWRQGVLVCVSAGNEGQLLIDTSDGPYDLNTLLSIGDPANLDDSVAVGSVSADKPHLFGVSHFSSRGPTADGRMKPDVVAPGHRIMSCNSSYKPNGKGSHEPYREDSGTSMACPHVSGLLAAFLSVRREFMGRPDEVKKILLENCNDLGRDRYHQGAGVPNLMKMLMAT